MAISTRFSRVYAHLRRLSEKYDQVQAEACTDTLKRFLLLLRVALPMHVALAAWFWQYRAPLQQPALQQWADRLTLLQMAMALALAVFGVLAHRLLRRPQGHGLVGLGLQLAFTASYLAFGALAAILDAAVGNGIATFLVVCMGTATLSLLRPWFSGAILGLALAIFVWGLRTLSIDATLQSSMLIQAISSLLMTQLISMMMWHQYATKVLLQRQLQASNAALREQQQALEVLAERDMLTGLYNRRKFLQITEHELARASRFPEDLCLLVVDLDHFKRINDQYGHPAGDAVLQHVAAVLSQHVRVTDTLARLGGEEFIVLMPSTPVQGAMALAEKLRTALRTHPLDWNGLLIGMTASLGVSGVAPGQHTSFEALYGAADQALYAAKHQGRDRVVCCPVSGP